MKDLQCRLLLESEYNKTTFFCPIHRRVTFDTPSANNLHFKLTSLFLITVEVGIVGRTMEIPRDHTSDLTSYPWFPVVGFIRSG